MGLVQVHCGISPVRSLKSGTMATMVGGPKEFEGTKGMLLYFWRFWKQKDKHPSQILLTFCIGQTQLSGTVPGSRRVLRWQKKHKCVQCGNFFGHMLSEIGEQEHCCEECIKEFKRSSETHSAIHSGEKKYNCAQCNKPFSQAGTLKRLTCLRSVQFQQEVAEEYSKHYFAWHCITQALASHYSYIETSERNGHIQNLGRRTA